MEHRGRQGGSDGTSVSWWVGADGVGAPEAVFTAVLEEVGAVGGTFDVTSPAGGGTTLLIEMPV